MFKSSQQNKCFIKLLWQLKTKSLHLFNIDKLSMQDYQCTLIVNCSIYDMNKEYNMLHHLHATVKWYKN